MARPLEIERTFAPSFKSRKNRKSGYALVSLLFLIPLGLMLVGGIGLVSLTLRNNTIAHANCRRTVWLAQVDMSKILTELLKLNPEARRLRQQRRLNELELKAARLTMQAPLIAALETHRALIIGHQLTLRQQQKILLGFANARRRQVPAQFNQNTLQVNMKSVKPQSLSIDLAVRFFPPFDLSPDAVPDFEFEKRQKQSLSWQADLLAKTPMQMMNTLKFNSLRFKGQCAATLQKEGNKWRPQLVADKS